ncbi:MAG: endonuclease/exonuclease/phosphatase family protein [Arenimonas sp.]|nr:endonuclease/exonuclease/phosphatase family protein [Arenimonas sp.]
MSTQLLKVISSNIQAGSVTRAYSEYVTRSWSHILPNGKRSNLDALAQTYAAFDVVGLQECDPGSMRSGFSNQSDYLAQKANFPHSSHHCTRRISQIASSGNALLSRFEPTKIDHFVLPGRIPGRGVLLAEFGHGESSWHAAVTHLSLSAKARRVQIAYLAELLSDKKRLILMGDFNCDLVASEMSRLFQFTSLQVPERVLPTFPSWDAKRPIDHILVGGMNSSNYQTHIAAGSDHLAIALDLEVPQ